jgi:hypothetical protein
MMGTAATQMAVTATVRLRAVEMAWFRVTRAVTTVTHTTAIGVPTPANLRAAATALFKPLWRAVTTVMRMTMTAVRTLVSPRAVAMG